VLRGGGGGSGYDIKRKEHTEKFIYLFCLVFDLLFEIQKIQIQFNNSLYHYTNVSAYVYAGGSNIKII
jgi:hypothetical protein